MFRKHWKQRLSAVAVGLLYGARAFAAPTDWSTHSPSLSRAENVARTHGSREKVRLLAEFPQTAGEGRWTDSNLVHVFPTTAQASYRITSLNNPRQFCPRVGELVTRINTTENSVMDILSVGLNQAREIGQLIDSLDAFKTANGSAFATVASVEAENGGLKTQITTYNDAIDTLVSVVAGLQGQISTLTTQRDAAQDEATNGVPTNNPTIIALQAEKTKLVSEIADLDTFITMAEKFGMDTSTAKSQRAQKQARVTEIGGLIDQAAGQYRAQKQLEANNLQQQINGVQTTIDSKATEIADYRQIVQDKRLQIVNNLTRSDYIAAQGTIGQYSAMLRQYTKLNQEFRDYRAPIISDAMLVVNFAKQNFNDLSTFDAGFATGVFPIWDNSALQLPGYLASILSQQTVRETTPNGTYTRQLPAVNAQLGTLYDVAFSTQEGTILSSAPFKFSTYKIDQGRVIPLPNMSIGEVDPEQKYAGFTRVNVILGSNSQQTDVVSDDLVNNEVNPKKTLRSTGDNPQAEIIMGLGTFCGNIEAQQSEVSRSTGTGFFVSFEQTRYVFTPRSVPVFGVGYTVDYKIKAQSTPHEARCEFHVQDYYTASRNWGSSSFNFLGLVRRESRWDARHISDLQQQGFFCTFVSPTTETDADRKKELDALNEMAVAEAYGRFVETAAKQWHPEQVSPAELEEFKLSHPRHTWSPALQLLCGGNPFCNVVIEVFNNIDDIAATGATSIQTSGRLDLTVKTQRSWATTLPGQVVGNVDFTIPNP